MSLKVIWSAKSKKNYIKIADFILEKWTAKEVKKFSEKTAKAITQIVNHPEIAPVSQKKHIRKFLIAKQTSLYYSVQKNTVILVTFQDNRQNPKKLKL